MPTLDDLALRPAGYDAHTTNLDYLTRTAYPIIDELGVEPLVNDYGEKYEGFNRACRIEGNGNTY